MLPTATPAPLQLIGGMTPEGALGGVSSVVIGAVTSLWQVDVLVAVAAGLTAVTVIWRKAIAPVVRAAALVAETAPTLVAIGQEFRADGNGSLRSAVDRIEGKADKAAVAAAEAARAALVAVTVSNNTREEVTARLVRIEEAVGAVPSGDGEAAARIERIEQAVVDPSAHE